MPGPRKWDTRIISGSKSLKGPRVEKVKNSNCSNAHENNKNKVPSDPFNPFDLFDLFDPFDPFDLFNLFDPFDFQTLALEPYPSSSSFAGQSKTQTLVKTFNIELEA